MKYIFLLLTFITLISLPNTAVKASMYDVSPMFKRHFAEQNDYLQSVNENRLSRLEVKQYLKTQQIEILKLLDKFYLLRNEMNTLVEPGSIRKPPHEIIDRKTYKNLLTQQIEVKQQVVNLYYQMEKQIYEWESIALISEHVRVRAEQDMLYFRKSLHELLKADDIYLVNFEKLVLFFETDYKSYHLIDGKLHFVRKESMQYFELIQDKLVDSNDDQEHYVFVLKETVRMK